MREIRNQMQAMAQRNAQLKDAQKDDTQKVRLKLNQITPDNFERKVGELREMLIGDRKLLNEDGFDASVAEGFQISEEILQIVV